MISLEKWKILTPLQNLPRNVGDLGKLIVAKSFKKLPKVQKIAQSGHTATKAAQFVPKVDTEVLTSVKRYVLLL